MRSRLLKFSQRSIFSLLFVLLATSLAASPNGHRTSTSLSEPPLDLVGTQASAMAVESDRYLWVAFNGTLKRIDTQTWSLTSAQPPSLSGNIQGLAIQGNFLYAAKDNGEVSKVDLNDVGGTPTTLTVKSGASLGAIVADQDGGTDDDKLYLLDTTNRALLVYDVGSAQTTSISLLDSVNQAVTPTSLVWVGFPTSNNSATTTDKVFVATGDGVVLVHTEGTTSATPSIVLSAIDKNLPKVVVSPNGNFLFVLNSSDGTLHVVDTNSNAEIDTNSSSTGTNPITVSNNSSLVDLAVIDVLNPDDVYAYVEGASGLSPIDLNLSTTFSGFSSLDSISLSLTPRVLAALSDTKGYLFTSNSDGTIAVISDNPFVTLRSTSLSGSLTTGGSFTLTFQSDEGGSYTVRVGGSTDESGTEVTSGTVSTAASDVTTSSISYSAGTFTEGTNRIFVFVEDSSGNVGWDAVDITVDTPPPSIEVTEATFGNGRVYVTFNRLTISDIDHYNIYVDTDSLVIATKSGRSGFVSQPASGDEVNVEISDLVNGTTYYVGIEAVDATGNVGTRTTQLVDGSAIQATPQPTVGPAEASGEAGCNLIFR